MTDSWTEQIPWRNAGFVVAGVFAGGVTAYIVESNLPPVLVMGVAFVAMYLADRYQL